MVGDAAVGAATPDAAAPPAESVRALAEAAAAIRENVSKVIVGAEEPLQLLLVALLARGHVLLEDVPGTGKTTAARAFARSIGADFHRIQCTPDLMPSDIVGVHYYSQKSGEFEFREGPDHGPDRARRRGQPRHARARSPHCWRRWRSAP